MKKMCINGHDIRHHLQTYKQLRCNVKSVKTEYLLEKERENYFLTTTGFIYNSSEEITELIKLKNCKLQDLIISKLITAITL